MKKTEPEEYPKFKCPQCQKITQLTFKPTIKKDAKKWKKYKCKCGYKNK